jgi:hypothetical protein
MLSNERLERVIEHNLDVLAALISSSVKNERGMVVSDSRTVDQLKKNAVNHKFECDDLVAAATMLEALRTITSRHLRGDHSVTKQSINVNEMFKE